MEKKFSKIKIENPDFQQQQILTAIVNYFGSFWTHHQRFEHFLTILPNLTIFKTIITKEKSCVLLFYVATYPTYVKVWKPYL